MSLQPDEIRGRKVYIYQAARVATQQGWKARNVWKIDWEQETRWQNPLMGWSSSGDPVGQTQLAFPSREAAIAFAADQGWTYVVKNIRYPKVAAKKYGSHFEYNWPRDIRPAKRPFPRADPNPNSQ